MLDVQTVLTKKGINLETKYGRGLDGDGGTGGNSVVDILSLDTTETYVAVG